MSGKASCRRWNGDVKQQQQRNGLNRRRSKLDKPRIVYNQLFKSSCNFSLSCEQQRWRPTLPKMIKRQANIGNDAQQLVSGSNILIELQLREMIALNSSGSALSSFDLVHYAKHQHRHQHQHHHHHHSNHHQQQQQQQLRWAYMRLAKFSQADAATAMVGLVRAILVILICVLLVKLRAIPSDGSTGSRNDLLSSVAHAGRARRRRTTSSSSNNNNNSISNNNNGSSPSIKGARREQENESQLRETIKISPVERQDQLDRHQQQQSRLGAYYNQTNFRRILAKFGLSSDIIESTPIQRRYSQPILTATSSRTISPLATAQQKATTKTIANERRRRHSDTNAILSTLQLPPGPIGLPFLGYLPFLGSEIHLTLTELSERFGPIYQIFLGGIRVVVLNDASLVRQAFKQTVFSGRPDTQLTRILQGYGIVNSDGALWKEQRAFLHSALRKLGAKSLMSGTNGLEAKIQNQVKEFVNDLSAHADEGKPCQVRPIVARAVSSVVGSVVMNLTYRKYEEKFDRLIELMQEGFKLVSIAMPLDFIPLLRFLPGVGYAFQKMKRNRVETSAFFQTVANEHRLYLRDTFNLDMPNSDNSLHPPRVGPSLSSAQATFSSNNQATTTTISSNKDSNSLTSGTITRAIVKQKLAAATPASLAETRQSVHNHNTEQVVDLDKIVVRDLVDAYIVQQKKHENEGKENYFSDQQLVQIMSDIFSAGLETVTSTIEWSILFMILNPKCQDKIHEEIDKVIGRSRLPQLDDIAQMPYTEATIYEVIRRSNVVALGNAHATLADATIGGYRIPKGTQVLPNLYGINMNPKLWNQPDRFDPSRFIVNERAQKPDYFIPFSVGRRMCLGDVLAKMEVFLFLVGLLQKYDLFVHEDDRACPPKVKGTIGVSNSPVPFRVALRARDQKQQH